MVNIYVIYHLTLDNANIFTLDKEKIAQLIQLQTEKYEGTTGQWRYRQICEEEEFLGKMNIIPAFS
jgi:hypothetical protein